MCICLLVVLSAFPLGVDVNEINTGKIIEFINYTGQSKQYSVNEIKGWGSELASSLRASGKEGKYGNQFVVIHAFDTKETGKFDAEIVTLTRFCTVKHINTVRLVLAGFLESQYGYSPKDSITLAVFITYYNAIYRGNMSYFTGKYKKIVVANINQSNAGISTDYRNWPGTTALIIPMSENAKKGDLGALDTSTLTDEKVIDTMRKTDGKSIDERESMVNLKEREVAQDKKDVTKDKEDLIKKEDQLAKDKEQLAKEKAALEKEKEAAKTITDKEERAAKEKEIADKEKEIANKEKDVANLEKQTTETSKDIADKESDIAKKETEIKTEKESLAKDTFVEEAKKDPEKKLGELFDKQKELDKREDAIKDQEAGSKKVYAGKFYYLKVKEYLTGGHYNNEMYILDAPTLSVVANASNKNICGRMFDVRSNGVVVITHTGSHSAGHYLSLLNLETLDTVTTGTNAVFFRSFVEIKDNYIYAVVDENNTYYLGKFDATNLTLVAKSKDKVDADTLLSFYRESVFVNNVEKKILALNSSTLDTVNVFTP